MAKVSSTASARPASRQSQGTPQDVPASAPARATRSTRSQSREPSEQPPTPGREKGNKNVASKKAGGRKKNAAAELATVEEDVPQDGPVEEENPNMAETEEEQEVAVDALEARRMSVGAMSGTTAKTSFSQEEIGGLDPDVMVDVLPNLASASNDLARLLLPADPNSRAVVRKEIRKSGTKYNKLFHNRCAAIAIHKRSFGSTDYIQPSIVLRALLGVQHIRDVSQGPWRPDNIIYKINLAQMLRTLLITLPDNSTIYPDGYDETSNLDVNFGSGIAGPVFSPRAFDMCLSFLTQVAIVRMTAPFAEHAFSPTTTIVEAFYMSDEDGNPTFKHASVLHMAELEVEQQVAYGQAIQQRVDQLTDLFNEADPSSWAQSLAMSRVQFTWDEFLEHVIHYYLERNKELDDEIEAVGGSAQIMLSLAEEVDRRADARKAAEKRQSFTRPSRTPKKGFGKAGIRKLKAREKDLAAIAAMPPASAPVAQMVQPDFSAPEQTAPAAIQDDWVRQDDEDELFVPPEQMQSTAKSSLAALSGIQNIQRQNAAKGKGRSFIDPQPGATRVSFDDSQSQTAQYEVPGYQQQRTQSGPYYQSPSRSGAKRPYAQIEHDEEDFEPTQDQGFETDMRDPAAADQRRRELPPPARAPQPRFSSMGSAVPGPSGSAQNSPIKRARKNPGSSIPPPMRPYDPDDDREIPMTGSARLNQARINSRHYTVMAVARKPTQVRTPWTEAEESALIDYIVQECGDGVQYAKIKQIDANSPEQVLERRSAEDIRFKCRNMKETFLKGHMELPQNFDKIALDKKAIEKLRSLNIPYEQDAIRARPVLDE